MSRRWTRGRADPGLRLVLRSVVSLAAVGAAYGCAGALPMTRAMPPPASASQPGAGIDEPWELPANATPTQRLYRVRYEGPEGKLSFKLSVYLESPASFRMQAADAFGRKLWALAVGNDDQALWLNHRDRTFCRTDARRGLIFVPLTRLPLEAVPRLLAGRLPEPPFADLRRAPGKVSYQDILGREWTAVLDAVGTPQRWSLAVDGEPVAWWQVDPDGPGALFSDRRGGQQVRWREVVREPLERAIAPEQIPDGYQPARCAPGDRQARAI